ncbi:NAD(P)H-dependent flavin oxidoreductase [Nocardioides sp. NPDC057767]|uniref:NAD(P)H-dependent flavin oxidoreductase n=1 Tax=unclassified Nocardioides TaxID=2615069 RepID=UPI0033325D47
MALTEWTDRLRIPAIAAPMTDVSGPDLVAEACCAGVVGAFPSHNAASSSELERWLAEINERRAHVGTGTQAAPVAVNLVVHPTNSRLDSDLRAVLSGGVEVVITSVGSPRSIVGPLHDAGVTVLADVASIHHARRAIDAGVDGVVLLTAGAGGQTGWANAFAFTRAVRDEFNGMVVLAGGVSDGAGILAARVLGADLAYLGTRFIATTESLAPAAYRAGVVAASLDDVATTTQVTGLAANVLSEWLRGVDPAMGGGHESEAGFSVDRLLSQRGVWAAGHSVSGTDRVLPVAELVALLDRELREARSRLLAAAFTQVEND